MSAVSTHINKKGEFVRSESGFRNWITADGSSGFKAEANRYHLYVSLACPWAHRTLIVRKLKGLESVISVDVVDWLLEKDGWKFTGEKPMTTLDTIHNFSHLSVIYALSDPTYRGNWTVPVLFDKIQKKIVSNESSEIIRMLNSEFNEFCATEEQKKLDLYPKELREKIDELNEWIYRDINNGVYCCGFATSQEVYDSAVVPLFEALDRVEGILSKSRYLTGNKLTEADVRLFTTIVRFDAVYHGHFKCNKKRIIDYPNIWAFTKDIYQTGGVASTVNFEHIKKHYQVSHRSINPYGIVSIGPDLDFMSPHGREALQKTMLEKVGNLSITGKPDLTPAPPRQEAANQEDEKPLSKEDSSLLTKVLRAKLVESTKEVEIHGKDPNSPLYSVKSFEELPLKESLRKGVHSMGFNSPSKIQATALPMLLADPPNSMIAQSQSGTGKTAAFVLTMLSRVNAEENFPQVICLSPTMELAKQTGEVAEQMSKFCPEIKITYAIRGRRLARGEKVDSHIIIGTPGTLLDWILKFRAFDPRKIRVFVFDEADVMIATQGHQDQIMRIHKFLPKVCQMLLFSATYEDEVMKLAERIIPDPLIIRLRRGEESLENIRQFYVLCQGSEQKFEALCNMYGLLTIGQCIVFCHTRRAASWLTEKMSREGHSIALLSGEITVEQRIAVLNRFREGKEKLLITTNARARGIGIEQVSTVVNFDIPIDTRGRPDFETYLYRIERTGRFGRYGLAINFVNEGRDLPMLKEIEKHFGRPIEELNTNDLDALEKLSE